MQSHTSRNTWSQHAGQWLLALMVIAASAVIVISLFALARMTGVLPHAGLGQHEVETDTAREKSRRMPKDREDAAPQGDPAAPATTPGSRSPRRSTLAIADAGVVAPSPAPSLVEARAVAPGCAA